MSNITKRVEFHTLNYIEYKVRDELFFQVDQTVREKILGNLRNNLLDVLLDQMYLNLAYHLRDNKKVIE